MTDETTAPEAELMQILENGVKAVLKDRKATSGERIAAVNAGAKLLMIKYRITGGDEKSFFDQ